MALTVTLPQIGGSEDQWGGILNTAINAVVAEVNENADGTNAITPNLTEGSWEISTTPVTASAADLNAIDGFAATSVTVAELGYLSGATSNIQNQIDTINAASGSGTVTSVGLNMPTGFSVSGSPITTSGTLAVTLASGYVIPQSSQIPSTSDISNWNTAYGWGDHSSQGYLTSAPAPTTAQVGSATTGLLADSLGAYAFLKNTSGNPDGTASGSSMYYSNSTSNANVSGTNPSGTWRRMGYQADTNPTVFLKILT